MGYSKLTFRLEEMVKDLLNKFVVKDKTFRLSAVVGIDQAKRIFGNALTPSHIEKLKGHDGLVALFVDDTELGGIQRRVRSDTRERRQKYKEQAQTVLKDVEPYLGKPVLEIWEGMDIRKNIFGAQSMYICCFFALDESGFGSKINEDQT